MKYLLLFCLLLSCLDIQAQSSNVHATQSDILTSTPVFAIPVNESTNINLFLLGSWTAKLGFATGISWIPQSDGSYVQELRPAKFLNSTPLTNHVDLTTSLFINENFYFEGSFHSGFTDTSIALGYRGNGIIRDIKIATSGIGIQGYPYIRSDPNTSVSPGIFARFASDISTHEVMLRYETTREVQRLFSGRSEYHIEERSIQSYVAGKYFLLPDTRPEELKIWIEDAEGLENYPLYTDTQGGKYRLLKEGRDYAIEAESGELRISNSFERGSLLVHYQKNGMNITSRTDSSEIPVSRIEEGRITNKLIPFSLQENSEFHRFFVGPLNRSLEFSTGKEAITLSDYTREIRDHRETVSTLVLYELGVFSPFEVQAYYTAGNALSSIELERGKFRDRNLPFRLVDGVVQILTNEGASSAWSIRYPLLHFDADQAIYGPTLNLPARDSVQAPINPISLQFISQIGDGIYIGESFLPGSLILYRNGRLVNNYRISDGRIQFNNPLTDLDDIRLRYRVVDTSGNLGNIVAATGHSFYFDNGDTLDFALAGSFAIPNSTDQLQYLQRQSSSYLQFASAYTHEEDEFRANIEASIEYQLADNTKNYSPIANLASSKPIQIVASALFPSAIPTSLDKIANLPNELVSLVASLNQDNRGTEVFRNYRNADRGALQSRRTATTASSNPEPEPLNTAFGPYPLLAASGDPAEGTIATIEFDLQAGEWVGYQLYIGEHSSEGFINALSLLSLVETVSSPVHVFAQFGSLGEDIDGDFVLDMQQRPEDKGMIFNRKGQEYLAGYPGLPYVENWRGLSEDQNQNGRLDRENPARIIAAYLGTLQSTDSRAWKQFQLNLSQEHRLQEPYSFRIILLAQEASAGRVFFGDHKLVQSRAIAIGTSADILEIKNSSQTSRTEEFQLLGRGSLSSEIRIPLASTSQNLYQNLEVQILSKDIPSTSELEILINGSKLGRFTIGGEDYWQSIRIDLVDKTIQILGQDGSTNSAKFIETLSGRTLDYLALKVSPNTSNESAKYKLRVQPPQFSGSQDSFAAAGRVELEWSPQGAIIGAETLFKTGISRLHFSTSAASPGFLSNSGTFFGVSVAEQGLAGNRFASTTRGANLDSSLGLSGFLPFFATSIEFRVFWDYADRLALDSSHKFTFDSIPGFFFHNSFTHNWLKNTATEIVQSNVDQVISFEINPLPWFAFSTGYSYLRKGENQNREWAVSLGLGEWGNGFFVNTDARFTLNEGRLDGSQLPEGYFDNFFDSIRLIDWGIVQSKELQRKLGWNASMGYDQAPFAFELKAEIASNYSSAKSLSENLRQSAQFDIFTDTGLFWTITMRQDNAYQGKDSARDYFELIEILFGHASTNPYFLAPIYLFGVFLDDIPASIFTTASSRSSLPNILLSSQSYTNISELGRSPSLGALDLLVPSRLSVELSRKIQWNRGLLSDIRSLGLVLSWKALNLFGRLGSTPLFESFRSDEYYFDLQYKHNIQNSDDWRISGTFSPEFFELGELTSLKNVFTWGWSNVGKVSASIGFESTFKWKTPIEIPTSPESASRNNSPQIFDEIPDNAESIYFDLEHQESITLRYSGLRKNAIPGSLASKTDPGFALILKHRTSLPFSSYGDFSLDFAIAYSADPIASQNYAFAQRIGLELNALLELSF